MQLTAVTIVGFAMTAVVLVGFFAVTWRQLVRIDRTVERELDGAGGGDREGAGDDGDGSR